MISLTITAIGTPKQVQTQFGPKDSNFIKAAEAPYEGKYLNYFVQESTKLWKVGDVIEVEDIIEREKNGTIYYNLKLPNSGRGIPPEVAKGLEDIKNSLTKINLLLNEVVLYVRRDERVKVSGTNVDYPQMDSSNDGHGLNDLSAKKF